MDTSRKSGLSALAGAAMKARSVTALALSILCAACTVGPDFKRPEPPAAESYTRGALPQQTASAPIAGGEAQRFVTGQDIPGQWWTLFQSRELNSLIERSLRSNPTVAAAQAAL